MSRYTGPSWKVSRRLGFSTLETGREIAKRNYAPGPHGPEKKKKLTHCLAPLRVLAKPIL